MVVINYTVDNAHLGQMHHFCSKLPQKRKKRDMKKFKPVQEQQMMTD
jgi:hypothetical protein